VLFQEERRAIDSFDIIRRLGTFEGGQIRGHLLRLSEEDRHLRFGGHATPERVADHCAALDLSRVVVLGCMVDGVARGIGELRPIPGAWPRTAEVAISVERQFQGRGIGGTLLRRLTRAARNRWIQRLHMLCLLDNGRMVRLARQQGSRLSFEDGQIEASLELPWPTGWTLLEELAGDASAWWATRPAAALPAYAARSRRARACADGSSAA
jgi:GNAT superfamily N-acetyltransferase